MNLIESQRIILVEDDADDIDIFREVLRSRKLHIELQVCGDSQSLLSYLADHRPPALIICDIRLVRETGLDLRQKLLASGIEGVGAIPFIFWSTGMTSKEHELAARLRVQGCFIKEPVFERLTEQIVHMIRYYAGPPGELA